MQAGHQVWYSKYWCIFSFASSAGTFKTKTKGECSSHWKATTIDPAQPAYVHQPAGDSQLSARERKLKEREIFESTCDSQVEWSPLDGPETTDPAPWVSSAPASSASPPSLPAAEPADEPARKKAKKQESLIPNPPVIPAALQQALQAIKDDAMAGSSAVETNLQDQRGLKQKLEQEERERKANAKAEAENKRLTAANKALARAEAKLEKAKAKALAVKQKSKRSCKKDLDPSFQAVDDTGSAPVHASPQAKKNPGRDKTHMKLSPAAKALAASRPKATSSEGRVQKAATALQKLRDLEIHGLPLPPPDFTKKPLFCIWCCAKMWLISSDLFDSSLFVW